MNKSILIAFTLFAASSVAVAGETSSAAMETSLDAMDSGFSKMDANSDGTLTLEEVGPDSSLAKRFASIDKDSSGGIDANEFQLFNALTEAD